MIEIHTKLRSWGNSIGIILPQKAIEHENAKVGETITVILRKDNENVLREMFGTFKFKKPVARMMEEIDKELYD